MDTLNKPVKVWKVSKRVHRAKSANSYRNTHSVYKIAFRNIFVFPKSDLLDPHLCKHRNLSLLLKSQVLVTHCNAAVQYQKNNMSSCQTILSRKACLKIVNHC